MGVNKVVYGAGSGAKTLIDLTGDSVTPESLAEGVTAHDKSGERIVGTMPIYKNLTLGVHTDGLLYVFSDGKPIGNGVAFPSQLGDVYGNVDSGNNIVLTGNLADGNYTVKYEKEDGTTIDIGNLPLVVAPTYTNLAKNFEVGRLNSSGAVSTTNLNHSNVYTCTDYIGKLVNGDVIRVKGMGDLSNYNTSWYNENKELYSNNKIPESIEITNGHCTYSYDSKTDVVTITKTSNTKGYSYIRFCGVLTGTLDDVVITLNEEIV